MERKFANRPEWQRVLQKRYYQTYLETEEFKGYAALLCLDSARAPLVVKVHGKPVCIVDSGYSWLQYFPTGVNYTVTAVFDAHSQAVYWYIDICLQTGLDENNIPWMDDLYLDIAVLPSGEVELLDADELEEAYQTGEITKEFFELALRLANELMNQIHLKEFPLIFLCKGHREMLLSTQPIATA